MEKNSIHLVLWTYTWLLSGKCVSSFSLEIENDRGSDGLGIVAGTGGGQERKLLGRGARKGLLKRGEFLKRDKSLYEPLLTMRRVRIFVY